MDGRDHWISINDLVFRDDPEEKVRHARQRDAVRDQFAATVDYLLLVARVMVAVNRCEVDWVDSPDEFEAPMLKSLYDDQVQDSMNQVFVNLFDMKRSMQDPPIVSRLASACRSVIDAASTFHDLTNSAETNETRMSRTILMFSESLRRGARFVEPIVVSHPVRSILERRTEVLGLSMVRDPMGYLLRVGDVSLESQTSTAKRFLSGRVDRQLVKDYYPSASGHIHGSAPYSAAVNTDMHGLVEGEIYPWRSLEMAAHLSVATLATTGMFDVRLLPDAVRPNVEASLALLERQARQHLALAHLKSTTSYLAKDARFMSFEEAFDSPNRVTYEPRRSPAGRPESLAKQLGAMLTLPGLKLTEHTLVMSDEFAVELLPTLTGNADDLRPCLEMTIIVDRLPFKVRNEFRASKFSIVAGGRMFDMETLPSSNSLAYFRSPPLPATPDLVVPMSSLSRDSLTD